MIRTSVMGIPRSASALNELSSTFLSLLGVNWSRLSDKNRLERSAKPRRRFDDSGKLCGAAGGGRLERRPASIVVRAVEQARGNPESQRLRVVAECCARQDGDAELFEQHARKRHARVDAALGEPVARTRQIRVEVERRRRPAAFTPTCLNRLVDDRGNLRVEIARRANVIDDLCWLVVCQAGRLCNRRSDA